MYKSWVACDNKLYFSENDVLREDVNQHFNREADLRAKVTHLEHELRTNKEELLKLKEAQSVQPIVDPLQVVEVDYIDFELLVMH